MSSLAQFYHLQTGPLEWRWIGYRPGSHPEFRLGRYVPLHLLLRGLLFHDLIVVIDVDRNMVQESIGLFCRALNEGEGS